MRFLAVFLLMFLVTALIIFVVRPLFYSLNEIDSRIDEELRKLNETYQGNITVVDLESSLAPFAKLVEIAIIVGTLFIFAALFIHTRRRE